MRDKMARQTFQPRGPASGGRRRARSRGQTMVEFALILPVLVLILAGAADFGRAFTAYITISSAAREGAAYGMQSTTQSNDTAGIQAAALADAPEIWGVAPEVFPSNGTDAQGYEQVSVTVTYTFAPIITLPPIIPAFIDMERTVTMRVLN